MAWRLKLSSTFVYGASSTCVHATAKMRMSSSKDMAHSITVRVPWSRQTGPEPFPDIDGNDARTSQPCFPLSATLTRPVGSYSSTSTCFSSHGQLP